MWKEVHFTAEFFIQSWLHLSIISGGLGIWESFRIPLSKRKLCITELSKRLGVVRLHGEEFPRLLQTRGWLLSGSVLSVSSLPKSVSFFVSLVWFFFPCTLCRVFLFRWVFCFLYSQGYALDPCFFGSLFLMNLPLPKKIKNIPIGCHRPIMYGNTNYKVHKLWRT